MHVFFFALKTATNIVFLIRMFWIFDEADLAIKTALAGGAVTSGCCAKSFLCQMNNKTKSPLPQKKKEKS